MPITNHIIESTPQSNGGTSNVLRMYDGDAREFMQTFYAPAGFNVEAKVATMIAELDEQLALQEFQALVGL